MPERSPQQTEIAVKSEEDMAAFWLHLTEDLGTPLALLHGDPFLMHAAAAALGLCDRTYLNERPTSPGSGRASHG